MQTHPQTHEWCLTFHSRPFFFPLHPARFSSPHAAYTRVLEEAGRAGCRPKKRSGLSSCACEVLWRGRRAGPPRTMIKPGMEKQSDGLQPSLKSGASMRTMFSRSKSDITIAQTMQLLKARGINVATDSTQLPKWYMIDSRTSRHIAKWDATLLVALVFVALLTPFEVAFLPAPQSYDVIFVINRALGAVFAVDMVVVCFRIVAVTSHMDGMRWIVKPRELFGRYCRSGWFFIDLFTLIVSAMDIVTPMTKGEDASFIRKFKARAPNPPANSPDPSPPQLDYPLQSSEFSLPISRDNVLSARSAPHPTPPGAQVLRVLRAVRLMRLAKLLSASRTLQELETQLLVGHGSSDEPWLPSLQT